MSKVDYHRYLASREWRLKREQVIKRSGNVCERCRSAPISDVHHLSYKHLGGESPEDLQGLCRPCHEFESAVTDQDPAERAFKLCLMRNGLSIDTSGGEALHFTTGPFTCDFYGHPEKQRNTIMALPWGDFVWLHVW